MGLPAHRLPGLPVSYRIDRTRDPSLTRSVEQALAPLAHSAWVGIRYGAERSIVDVTASPSRRARAELERIATAEDGLHLRASTDAVVPSRASLAPYSHGLTYLGHDERGLTMLLIVLREEPLGRFTEQDRELMRAAGEALAARLAEDPAPAPEAAQRRLRARSQAAFFVLTLDGAIDFSWLPEDAAAEHVRRDDERLALAPDLAGVVRGLTRTWEAADPSRATEGTAIYGTFIVRAVPMQGAAGLRAGVTVERLRTRDALAAASQFGFSAREFDVLALLLEGCETREIARVLKIAPTTASDHVKRMLLRTGCRNRVELVARTLGWGRGANAAAAGLPR
jgi:DNA-binding CsgD family transcriptional regulator